MSQTVTLIQLAALASRLPPPERKRLAEMILQELAEQAEMSVAPRRRSWRELRGILPQGVYGADAQAWVSTSRRESDEQRELGRKDAP